MSGRLLVVDDEELIRWSLRERLTSEGYTVTDAADGTQAEEALSRYSFDAALVDLRLPDTDGFGVMEIALRTQPDLPVIIITAYSSVETAVRALKAGAVDYLTKPFDMDELALTVQRAIEQSTLRRTVSVDVRQKNAQFSMRQLVGQSPQMEQVRELLQRIADAHAASTVLLLGESGTGKDLAARAIHYASSRAQYPFMNITCTALPEGLLESELFGHEAGAFTGATGRKKGLFELAHRGTVFLDEIGDMPPLLQAKLLRVLEEKCFKRIGGSIDIHIDVRIIAATNQPLEQLVQEREFREDLYYRLNIVPIQLPPLRERTGDIALVAQHFLGVFAREFKKEMHGITDGALARLRAHHWPGNVRELRNVIERAVLLSERRDLNEDDLAIGPAPHSARARNGELVPMPPEGCTLAEAELSLVRQALERCDNNLTQAGRILGISRDQVRYTMERHGLRPPSA